MTPAFLDGISGKLFTLYFPYEGSICKGAVLHVPAFAEEMNKSRHMVSWQARELAKQGYGVLVFDLFGTGDSEGEFIDIDWNLWIEDIKCLVSWLAKNVSTNITLWGLRLGCLLATISAVKNQYSERLLFWQPVLNGEQYMQQFLRLRLASNLFREGEKETVKSLKTILDAGQALEVAGYRISPQLFSSICQSQPDVLALRKGDKVAWLEISNNAKPLSVPSQKVITHWQRESGVTVFPLAIEGRQFWSNQEIVKAENLISETTRIFAEGWS